MKLHGWTRLGTVVSVAWIVVVAAVTIYQLHYASPGSASFFVHFVPGSIPDPTPYTISGQEVRGVVWDIPAVSYPVVATITTVPLVCLWLGVPLLVSTYRWIRRGFHGEP